MSYVSLPPSALPRIRRLRLSGTLTAYIGRQFAFWFASFFLSLVGIIYLVSLIDLLDKAANKEAASLGLVLQMAFLKLPHLSQEIMPFTVLFAGLATFWRLTRSNELVVARAAGVSVWQFLLPVLTVASLIGILTFSVLNPLSSVLLSRFEQLENRYLHHKDNSTLLSSEGKLWLRQADEDGQSVIHADGLAEDNKTLLWVTIWRLQGEDRFESRIDAKRAELRDGFWRLYETSTTTRDSLRSTDETLDFPTELTFTKIQERFAAPETISFWSLPSFIEVLEAAGFNGQRHRLEFHRLLSIPVLLAAMILIAATFSLRPQRRGRVGLVVLSGVGTGFLMYFLSNLVFALGLSGKIPVVLAGWTPAAVSLMLGISMLLHLEDG